MTALLLALLGAACYLAYRSWIWKEDASARRERYAPPASPGSAPAQASTPRAHHFQMKYLLVQIALQDPQKLLERVRPGGDAAYLPDLWTALGMQLPPPERIPDAGLEVLHLPPVDGRGEALVVTLPAPAVRSEAHFIGVLFEPGGRLRVFCLERSGVPGSAAPATVLVEFIPRGRLNWGPGPAPDRDAFLGHVRGLAADEAAQPLSFVEVPLA